MNAASSERLVVFVTPAQKRVLAARAERMGISVSELVRRAVLAFDETGQEVRAAGLIDRLGAASEAGLHDPLRRLAQAAASMPEQERGAAGASAAARLATEPATASGCAADGTQADGEAAHGGGPASGDGASALPVAAAVARALLAREAEPDDTPDPETQALVGRLLDAASPGSV